MHSIDKAVENSVVFVSIFYIFLAKDCKTYNF
jgi:hypothetical protein